MMRRLGALTIAATLAGGVTMTATPAQAVEVCDPNRFVCVYVDDARNFCPGGYEQLLRVPRPGGGVVLLICALQ
jgi:hypothetical protein